MCVCLCSRVRTIVRMRQSKEMKRLSAFILHAVQSNSHQVGANERASAISGLMRRAPRTATSCFTFARKRSGHMLCMRAASTRACANNTDETNAVAYTYRHHFHHHCLSTSLVCGVHMHMHIRRSQQRREWPTASKRWLWSDVIYSAMCGSKLVGHRHTRPAFGLPLTPSLAQP